MQEFGFEWDPFEFRLKEHGIDDSHCKNLRPKHEYREQDTGRRLKFVNFDARKSTGSHWLVEEGGEWVPIKNPKYMDHILSDDDSDVAYYLNYMTARYGERVSQKSVLKIEEPMRSAVLSWSGLDRFDLGISDCVDLWLSDEYGLVVTSEQMWFYMVYWISPEGLEKARERVRQLKAAGDWEEVHPDGCTKVFRT